MTVDAVEEFGIGHPIPRHPSLHRGVGNGLSAGHREHRAVAHLRLDRREAETAIANHDRGHAMPARNRAVRIPEKLCVVMGVQIDEAGHDVLPLGVDHFLRLMRLEVAELCDLAVLDPDVRPITRQARTIDDHSACD